MKPCIVCGSELYPEPLLKLENMPRSAQELPGPEDLKQDRGITLPLCQCSGCGLVQFDCEPVPYFRDVIRAGGYTQTMVDLRFGQYQALIDKYALAGRKFIEIGAGQGEFLGILESFDVRYAGIEHSERLVALAAAKGIPVMQGFVEDAAVVIPGGPYDVFLSFNFLEHQPRPNDMLRGIHANLTAEGMGLITVPSLEYILQHNGIYELIHDHIAYYTEDTFRFVLERNGFDVLECTLINRDTLSAVVRKKPRLATIGLEKNKESIRRELDGFCGPIIARGGKVAVWGASHQGLTTLSMMNLADKIAYVIDSAPFKQGRFTPATHLPIQAPDHLDQEPVDGIIVIAPGYSEEIVGIIRNRQGSGTGIAVLRSDRLEIVQ